MTASALEQQLHEERLAKQRQWLIANTQSKVPDTDPHSTSSKGAGKGWRPSPRDPNPVFHFVWSR